MDNSSQSSGTQFRPVGPAQQGQPFIPVAPQQFRPVGQGMPAGQSPSLQFSQPMQQLPQWPNQPGHATPSSQAVPLPYVHPNRPMTAGPPQLQQTAPSFTPPFGQPQNNVSASSQFQPMPQIHAPVVPAGGQPWLAPGSNGVSHGAAIQPTGQQPSVSSSLDPAVNVPSHNQQSSSDWQEHTASDGRRYYYNKRTKQSSWEKPFELMTAIERADASTVWKEFTTPEGKKYYYNKVTKQSKWSIPEELKLAREQAQQAVSQGTPSQADASHAPAAVAVTLAETSTTAISVSSSSFGVASSSVPVTPVVAVSNAAVVVSGSSALSVAQSNIPNAAGAQPPVVSLTPLPTAVSGSSSVTAALVNAKTSLSGLDNVASQVAASSVDGASVLHTEEVRKGMAVAGKSDANPLEEKTPDDEPLVFASKQEAKNAFKALLESANVQSDWTWEQTMREIINDKRYGALKTPGERKQAFNEYLGQRKKIEAEERRMRQKRARVEFTKMLEESKELTSSMKWSKAVSLFENDERFKAVEKTRDREDLFDNYIVELGRKEREKAAEDHRRNVAEYKKFLESCDFIKVNSPWRKVQDRLEDDERCLRLEKLDRLLIFQDYIRDLEKEEEEQKKIQKEQLRRAERKNRDQFRKLLEDHVADGSLTAKTHWHDYCPKVKDLPQYHAVATNSSGSTPRDLFDGVAEELEKQVWQAAKLPRRAESEREVSRKVREMKRFELLQTPRHEAEEMQGGSSQPSGQPIPEVEVIRSPSRQEEPPPPPPVALSAEGGPSQPPVRTLSRGAQVWIHSLEKNRTVRENPGFAKVLGSSICLREDRDRLSQDNLDDILTRSMSLNVECLVNQHIVREKTYRLGKEVEKMGHEVASLRSQLSSAQNYISEIEGRMKFYEYKLAERAHVLAERTHVLEEVQALRAGEIAHLTEELKAKEEEAVTREANAYVNAHRDLLAELKKRYPEEYFSWMVDLAPQDEEESEEEAEGERGSEQNVDQAGGNPSAE
ncbi:pre-mRNA-processing protein 40A isoform X3 [Hevea brasiliensis]|uniref:pre-mRNA-processing protein 40A isoform X3 n=1 Tax=Hevea brasiliensis TaxID=3981 RepID=UPI0025F52377|nr:pre-mRNA-processing protein 40A isoform X3 [Hevea brasiliensis]